jgi:hypothetical protein
MMDTL